jgi:hypothetical protein
MIAIATIAAAYLIVGVLVALRAVPWADVSIHAPFARRTGGANAGDPVRSPSADRLFFAVVVLLWPVAWRFRHVGAFAGDNAPPFEHVGVPIESPTADDDGQAAAIAAARQLLADHTQQRT